MIRVVGEFLCDMSICSNIEAKNESMQLRHNSHLFFLPPQQVHEIFIQCSDTEYCCFTSVTIFRSIVPPPLSRCIIRHCHRGRACSTLPGLQEWRSAASPQQIRSREKEVRAVKVALYCTGTPSCCKGAWVI